VEKFPKPGAKISQEFNISLRAKKKFFPRLAWVSEDCMQFLYVFERRCHKAVNAGCNVLAIRNGRAFHQYFAALLRKKS